MERETRPKADSRTVQLPKAKLPTLPLARSSNSECGDGSCGCGCGFPIADR